MTSVFDACGRVVAHHRPGAGTWSYVYDLCGRVVETRDPRNGRRLFDYDPAGQLLAVTDSNDGITRYRYDGNGRAVEIVFWDTAGYAGAPVLVGDTPILAGGPVTGIDGHWTAPGWRTQRTTDPTNPWTATTTAQDLGGGLPGGGMLGLTGGGGLSVGGLEWLGARVYDPASRGFLTTDPADPTPGAGWSGNPYSYAGNDPLHALDPRGLHPVTDAELAAYRDGNGIGGALHTAWNATTDWMSRNWEYVAGGAMVLAGGVLIATGVGGPVGMMLVSAGADTIIQKATTGRVDWGQVAVSGVLGGVGGGAALAAKAGATGLKAAVITGAYSGAVGGAGSGAYSYTTGPGPHTVGGFLAATGEGAAGGAILGGAGGAAGHGIGAGINRLRGGSSAAANELGGDVSTNAVTPSGNTLNAVPPTPASPAPLPAARLPQDISVSPQAPAALPLNRPVGGSATQNAFVQQRVGILQGQGASDFRVNQQQVDINGTRVGVNRPDLQYTANGQRVYEEFDVPSSSRGPAHQTRILANDPTGTVNLFTVP